MRKALVIGINKYPEAPLEGCENDANSIANLLEENENGDNNFSVKIKNNIKSKAEMKELVIELFSGENEVALFYFSGHGYQSEKKTYLVTPDYKNYDMGILMDEILDIANTSKSKNKIIILDCCFSGAFGGMMGIDETHSLLGEGVTILTASKKDEPSVEVCGHGIFTTLLLEALKGGAADITGNITTAGVYSYIDKALGPWDQRPIFKTNISQFLPIRKVEPKVPNKIIKEIFNYFPSPDHILNLDPSFEFTNKPQIDHKIIEPYAKEKNVEIFKNLQKYVSIGLVEPLGEEHMYFAAMNSKACKLTPLGYHYWKLIKSKRI